ncbi:MAG: hypothetical protein HYT90_02785 [Candidatus Omnitrophica bacterium]|nr:hypothetical protein [Candidatus Omnitrophota bacterium]
MTQVFGRWQARTGALLAVALSLGIATAWAGVPRTIAYQGKLTESNGAPLTGEHALTLRLYDAAAAGAKLWEEQHTITLTALDNGVFSLVLGAQTPFGEAITFNEPLWLTIEVDGGGEFSPRQPLSSVGYALNADTLDGLDSTALLTAAAGQGDITAVTPGTGLTGGGDSGAVSLSVDVGTAAGQIVQLDENGALPAVSGANLTGITAVVDGASLANLNASALTSGTVPDERLSANVSLLGPSIGAAELEAGAGVHSLAALGQSQLTGDVTLSAGSNITLAQAGNAITIAASGAGAQGSRVTTFASNSVAISSSGDTSLTSVTITKSQAASVLLVIATVQLNHSSGGNKTVDLKLFRDAAQLDASYRARIGTGGGQVEELPATVHAWDASGAGTYTFTLKGRASGNGATATVRRITVVELL